MGARGWGLIWSVTVLLGLAPSTAAGASYTTTVSPDPISWPQTPSVEYRLQVTTGQQAEELDIFVRPPEFPGGGELLGMRPLRVGTAGELLRQDSYNVHGDRFCSPPFPDLHGGLNQSASAGRVRVPANSSATVVAPGDFRSGVGFAPMLGMDLGTTFRVTPSGGQPQEIAVTGPANSGEHGVEITPLRYVVEGESYPVTESTPFGAFPCRPTDVNIGMGTPILLNGTTATALADQRMTLRVATDGSEPRDLATVPIAADGTFSYRWRPTEEGLHVIGAVYRPQAEDFVEDFANSPVAIRVGPTRTPAQPVPAPPTSGPAGPSGQRVAFRSSLLPSVAAARCLSGICRRPASRGDGTVSALTRGSVYRVAVRGRLRRRPCAGVVGLTYRVRGTRATKRRARVGSELPVSQNGEAARCASHQGGRNPPNRPALLGHRGRGPRPGQNALGQARAPVDPPTLGAMAQTYGVRNRRARQRALLIAAGPEEHDLSELGELLRTAGVAVAGELTQRRAAPDPDRYFGKGKLSELKAAIKASDANVVAVDDELAPRQERNLEAASTRR